MASPAVLDGVVLCASCTAGGADTSESIQELAQELGACVRKTVSKTVHMLIWHEGKQAMLNRAKKQGVVLVSPDWLQACMERGCKLSVDEYVIKHPTAAARPPKHACPPKSRTLLEPDDPLFSSSQQDELSQRGQSPPARRGRARGRKGSSVTPARRSSRSREREERSPAPGAAATAGPSPIITQESRTEPVSCQPRREPAVSESPMQDSQLITTPETAPCTPTADRAAADAEGQLSPHFSELDFDEDSLPALLSGVGAGGSQATGEAAGSGAAEAALATAAPAAPAVTAAATSPSPALPLQRSPKSSFSSPSPPPPSNSGSSRQRKSTGSSATSAQASAAEAPRRTPRRSPRKAKKPDGAATSAGATAKSPAKEASKSSAKRTSNSPAKRTSKSPAKRTSKSPAKRTSKSSAKRTSKSSAKRASQPPAKEVSKSPAAPKSTAAATTEAATAATAATTTTSATATTSGSRSARRQKAAAAPPPRKRARTSTGSAEQPASKRKRVSMVLSWSKLEDGQVTMARTLLGMLGDAKESPSDTAEDCTHLVVGRPQRTLKVLFAAARGAWMLDPSWLSASLDAGAWADESKHKASFGGGGQLRSPKGKAKSRSKAAQQEASAVASFKGTTVHIVGTTKPPPPIMRRLLTAAGARVTDIPDQATIIVHQKSRTVPERYSSKTIVSDEAALDVLVPRS